jgi:hypothetical protein
VIVFSCSQKERSKMTLIPENAQYVIPGLPDVVLVFVMFGLLAYGFWALLK